MFRTSFAVTAFSLVAQLAAFPGAEGFGGYATGGRGGDVYYVTNRNTSGTGSLAYGIANAPASRVSFLADVVQNSYQLADWKRH